MAEPKHARPMQPADYEQLDRLITNERIKDAWKPILALFTGLCALALAVTPLAKAVRGTDTTFSFNVSISISVSLAIAVTVTGTGWAVSNRRQRKARQRVRALEKERRILRGKLREAQGRES